MTCLRGEVQGMRGNPITHEQRAREDERAFNILGLDHEQIELSDSLVADALATPMRNEMRTFVNTHRPDVLICPAVERGGHDHHNLIAEIAPSLVDGGVEVHRYSTYTREYGRTREIAASGTVKFSEVVPEPYMVPLKLKALAEYESQILHDGTGTRTWFMDLHEYEFVA